MIDGVVKVVKDVLETSSRDLMFWRPFISLTYSSTVRNIFAMCTGPRGLAAAITSYPWQRLPESRAC
jgi:hypothetical protein